MIAVSTTPRLLWATASRLLRHNFSAASTTSPEAFGAMDAGGAATAI
ncbi:MAG: hypothetical protein M3385_09795 [Actinomycetota bacterium]|nr:hypothetical protein [Actinomycetota bacterium]